MLLLGILGGIGALAFSLSDDAAALIETLPEAAQHFRRILHKEGLTSVGVIDHMQKAANQLERAANDTGVQASPAPSGVTRVQIEQPKLNVQDFLRTGTLGAVALAGQAGVVLFLVYFLLVAGDTFRRKLVKITGPTLSKTRITVQVLDEITSQIQRYLLVQIATSLVVGVARFVDRCAPQQSSQRALAVIQLLSIDEAQPDRVVGIDAPDRAGTASRCGTARSRSGPDRRRLRSLRRHRRGRGCAHRCRR